MLYSKQTPAAGGTAFAQFDAAWCYDGNGYILNDTGTSLDVRIGASGSVQTLASGATLPIKLVFSMAELYVRRTDQSTTQVTVEAQVGTGSAGGGTSAEVGVIAAATAAAAVAGHNTDQAAHGGAFYRTFNVRAYGAVGDGVTDDTSAIQAAVSAALSTCPAVASITQQSSGAVIKIPAGSYLVTAPITLSGKALVRVLGDGAKVTRIRYTGASVATCVLSITDSSYCEVSDLTLDGGIAFSDFAAANAEALSAVKHANYGLYLDSCEYVTSRNLNVIGTRKGAVKGMVLWESLFDNLTAHYMGLSQESGKDGTVWLTNDGVAGRFGVMPCNNTVFVKPTLSGEGTLVRIDAVNTNSIIFSDVICEGYPFTTPPAVASFNKFEVSAGAFASFSGYITLHSSDTAKDADVFAVGSGSSYTTIRDFVAVCQKETGLNGRPFRYFLNTAAARDTHIDNILIQDTGNLISGAYYLESGSRVVGGITEIREGAGRLPTVHVTPAGFNSWMFDCQINIYNGQINSYRLGSAKMYHGASTAGVANNYEPTAFDDVIFVDTSSGARNINLNVFAVLKRRLIIKKISGDTNAMSITPINGYTLDGVTSAKSTTTPYAVVSVYADQDARGWTM